MATHGEGGLRNLLFGRVAQHVVQVATIPLVIVPAATSTDAFECKTLLIPLDGTPESEEILPFARSMMRTRNCRVVLVRVVPTPGSLQGAEVAVATLLPRATAAMLRFEETEARAYLNEIATTWFPDHQSTVLIRRGTVDGEIIRASKTEQADLVLMTHTVAVVSRRFSTGASDSA